MAFGTRDRSAAVEAMQALGFATSPPCSCEWEARGESRSAQAVCCVFPHDYMDFIAISDAGWDEHVASSPVYGRGLAPTGIVLSGVAIASASLHVDAAPYPILRHIRTDPPATVRYDFLPLAGLGLPLGLIGDSSPETLRRVAPVSHPNTASGMSRIHLRVASLRDAVGALAREPLSLAAARETPIGRARLHLHEQPTDPYLSRVLACLAETRRPVLLALEYPVASLEAAADVLRARGVRFGAGAASLTVDPDQGFGTGIVFTASTV